jgi:hypothetical protein
MPQFNRPILNNNKDMGILLLDFSTKSKKEGAFDCQTCGALIKSKDGVKLILHYLSCCNKHTPSLNHIGFKLLQQLNVEWEKSPQGIYTRK